ncbi:MAG: alternate F1F0 ATPase, F1 subunit alpha [Planctomycetes bacterium]|nr:alternate F1F0 ATPase, F1 subunit alpha [Planctomycetota bacterium]
MADRTPALPSVAADVARAVGAAMNRAPALRPRETGRVVTVGSGVATVSGLPGARSEELVRFPGGRLGIAFDLDREALGVILLDEAEGIGAGDEVRLTGRVADFPVGDAAIGRVLDASGRPRDGKGPLHAAERRPVESPAPALLDRDPVATPLQTGLKVVDALIPIGRGQRELILGDRQTGKTALAVDAILNQANFNVLCIYCAIGQRNASVAKVLGLLERRGAMRYTAAIVASGDDPAGQRYVAPYAAMTLAEYYMARGRDVLVVFDDLTHHARAYRELSLLLRRPPGREAFPGDIFYVHSRLLERATRLTQDRGGGSITALPIIETEAQNISAYIPTNLISITDGQLYLSPDLFRQGQLPAVHVGRSVSRVGGKAQLPAFRETAGDLRLSFAQFEELERFSRYGTRLEERQRRRLEHGRRVREILKQPQGEPMPAAEQVAVLLAVKEGLFDEVPVERISDAADRLRAMMKEQLRDVAERIESGQKLRDEDRDRLGDAGRQAAEAVRREEPPHGRH